MERKPPQIDSTQELKSSFMLFTNSLKNFLVDKSRDLSKELKIKYDNYRIKAQVKREEEVKEFSTMMAAKQKYMDEQMRLYHQENHNAQPQEAMKGTGIPTDNFQKPPEGPNNFYGPINSKDAPWHSQLGLDKRKPSFYKGALIGYGLGVVGTRRALITPLISAYIFGRLWEHCDDIEQKKQLP
eukprot:TRINITY_DN9596_c0_g1_i3.p1 TRINITY_DN9596_c0_g1~~TRINITY_DN9596_c0_g1_i3.p1  ORF type:complete len:184 (-),score=39.35 TRINITY_DN9596_c0_g1_i3:95-646(-)